MQTGQGVGADGIYNFKIYHIPQNHIATLNEARQILKNNNYKALEMIYDSVPDVLIRTILIPKEGHEFIVADFSAIEARVVAWLANEEWVLEAFRNGEDIYCSTASQMFGVPVKKHGINGDLRQKGKIAVLACGYSGNVGAFEMGLKR